MKKTICFHFHVHQPLRLKTYRFFNMGKDHNYLDMSANRSIIQRLATECYLPMNNLLLDLIERHKGAFKVSLSISGLAIEQFKHYTPDVLESFKKLAATGCVEFVAGSYSHSLSSLVEGKEFEQEVKSQMAMIKKEFGQTPTTFANTELIYSDIIGERVAAMGFKTMVTEGAKHVLGWKSPNYIYANAINQKLRLALRNYKLSDDICLRFSNQGWEGWPLTADKYTEWLSSSAGEVVNLIMDYETFGEYQKANSGIFEFMRALPDRVLATGEMEFATISEATTAHQPIGVLHCPHPMSWTDEERDITAWLGNELQNEAFSKLYAMQGDINRLGEKDYDYVWNFMKASDNFYYMATKWFSDGDTHSYSNPYDSSYAAFINYMNVLSDFEIEVAQALEAKKAKKRAAKTA